MRTFLISVCFR